MANKLLEPSFFDNSPANNPDADVALLEEQANVRAVADFVGAKPPQTAVILDGVVTPTGAFCRVGTEGESPADDLARINATRTADDVIHEGMVLHLCALDDAQVVTIKHSADIILAGGVDVVLTTDKYIVLQYIQGVWREVQVAMGVDTKNAIASVQDTFSTTAAVGKAPVAILDPETGEAGFHESWKMGNEVTQTINPDPAQASAEAVPSEQAVSNALSGKLNTSDIGYKCIYGTGQAPAGDTNAIEDDALGTNGTININSRYVLENPFGNNTQVVTKHEISIDGVWSHVPFVGLSYGGSVLVSEDARVGINSGSVEGEGIVVQTAANYLAISRIASGTLVQPSAGTVTTTACRIHVWKIGA